jgi:hypothetical protein
VSRNAASIPDQEPQSKDDALICIVLFTLADFKRDVFSAKHDLRQQQLLVAMDVVDFYGLATNRNELEGFCGWLRYKKHKPDAFRRLANDHTWHGECSGCATPGRLCQLPGWYADMHKWKNRNMLKEPGLCIPRHLDLFFEIGLLQYSPPTGWPLIDRIQKRYAPRH